MNLQPLSHEDVEREQAQAARDEWARRREVIEARKCCCDVASTAKGDQPLPSPDCPLHGRHVRGVVEVDETECGVRGGQGRPSRLVERAALVVAFTIAAYALLKTAGWL